MALLGEVRGKPTADNIETPLNSDSHSHSNDNSPGGGNSSSNQDGQDEDDKGRQGAGEAAGGRGDDSTGGQGGGGAGRRGEKSVADSSRKAATSAHLLTVTSKIEEKMKLYRHPACDKKRSPLYFNDDKQWTPYLHKYFAHHGALTKVEVK